MTSHTSIKPTRFKPKQLAYQRGSDGCDDTWDIYDTKTGTVLVSIHFWDCDPAWMSRSESLALLFAAAPDLLDAAKSLVRIAQRKHTKRSERAIAHARAAIARALGRA